MVPHLGQETAKLYQGERVHEDLGRHAGAELGVSRALLYEDDAWTELLNSKVQHPATPEVGLGFRPRS